MANVSIVRRIAHSLSNNSPAILTGIGVTGLVSTAVLAAHAAFKAGKWAQYSEEYNGISPDRKEIFQETWKYYIPAAVTGTTTAVCIIMGNRISTRRAAAMAGAYSLVDVAFKEYRDKVAEQIGVNKETAVRDAIAQDTVTKNPLSGAQVFFTGAGDQLCYDKLTGRYFHSDIDKIKKAQNELNAQVINSIYASQNDFYDLIGLPRIDMGDEMGWNSSCLLDLDFSGALAENGTPCIVINYRALPMHDYYKSYL